MEPIFFARTGVMALGSRLRRFSDLVTQDAAAIFRLADLEFEPRWFPVFYVLAEEGPLSVGEVAERIGQTHASVSQVARQMQRSGVVAFQNDAADGRRRLLALTATGRHMQQYMEPLYADVQQAVQEMLDATSPAFWPALRALEEALSKHSLLERVREVRRKKQVSSAVRIVNYEPQHAGAFFELNREWIERYFTMEAADHKALTQPDDYILKPGGRIYIALDAEGPVGTVALIRLAESEYELAKMAVSPRTQGQGIGYRLGRHAIDQARTLGARRLFLETNDRLVPAIRLYEKLGFSHVKDVKPSPYARSNVQMELYL